MKIGSLMTSPKYLMFFSVIFIVLFFCFFRMPVAYFSRHGIYRNSTELKFTKKLYIGKIFYQY